MKKNQVYKPLQVTLCLFSPLVSIRSSDTPVGEDLSSASKRRPSPFLDAPIRYTMAHFVKRLPARIHTPRTHRAVTFSSRAAPRMSTPSQQADLPSHPLETSPAQHSNKHHNALPPRTHARGLGGPQRQQRRAGLSPHHHHHRRRHISVGTLISCVVLQSPLPPPSNPPPHRTQSPAPPPQPLSITPCNNHVAPSRPCARPRPTMPVLP